MCMEVCPSTAASWMVCSWLVLVHRMVRFTCIEAHRSFMFACWRCILLTLLVPCDVSRPLEPHTWCKVPSARALSTQRRGAVGSAMSAQIAFRTSIHLQVCAALFHL